MSTIKDSSITTKSGSETASEASEARASPATQSQVRVRLPRTVYRRRKSVVYSSSIKSLPSTPEEQGNCRPPRAARVPTRVRFPKGRPPSSQNGNKKVICFGPPRLPLIEQADEDSWSEKSDDEGGWVMDDPPSPRLEVGRLNDSSPPPESPKILFSTNNNNGNRFPSVVASGDGQQFLASGGTPYLTIDGDGIVPKPSISIFPTHIINFAYEFVQLNVLALNIPDGIKVTHSMLDCSVIGPSGGRISCVVKAEVHEEHYLTKFQAGFKAGSEPGLYTVRARLVLPLIQLESDYLEHMSFGTCGDTHEVVISRNYFKDSLVDNFSAYLLDAWEGPYYINVAQPLYRTWGIASDVRTNRMYCSDRIGKTVVCIGPDGHFLFRFQQINPESCFNQPMGLSFDPLTNRVFVCDKGNHRISVFAGMGEYLFSFGSVGTEAGQLVSPWDVCVSPNSQHIAVADSTNRVQIFDACGRYILEYQIPDCEPHDPDSDLLEFDSPRNLAYDPTGLNIFVTDVPSGSIYRIETVLGLMIRIVHAEISPQGLAVDLLGNLLVTDPSRSAVLHISGDEGRSLCIIRGVGKMSFHVPVNITILRNGMLGILEGSGRFYTI